MVVFEPLFQSKVAARFSAVVSVTACQHSLVGLVTGNVVQGYFTLSLGTKIAVHADCFPLFLTASRGLTDPLLRGRNCSAVGREHKSRLLPSQAFFFDFFEGGPMGIILLCLLVIYLQHFSS